MIGVQLTLLGSVRAHLNGAVIDLGGPRQRGVLAMLAVARGQVVPVERLTDALWPAGARPSDPGASLQTFVSRLRRALQPDASARARGQVLVSGAMGYALRLDPDAVDTWRFERLVSEGSALADTDPAGAAARLRQALELWQGPPLADYAEDEWAAPEIARLNELRAVAHERLLAARLALGDAAVVVPDLEALAIEAPLREERWRLLALALYRANRQADALNALRRARAILADELGVDPGPALRAVEQEVLAQSPALAAPPAPAPAPPAAAPAPAQVSTSAPRPSDRLIERNRELALLDRCIDEACLGSGSVSVVEGPAGIGKSRLLTEARRRAGERGVRVIAARASQLEQEFSFGVARQLFEPLVLDPQQRDGLLSGAAGAAASMFDLAAAPAGSDDSSFAVLHGLYWLTVNATTQGPLVIVVDDIHWSDTGSLRFVAYLARRLEGLPVALLLAFRLGEQHPLGSLIDELRHDVGTVAVRPVPLTREAVAQMIEQRLGEAPAAEFVAACFDGTTGNPLLVRQLLRVLEADGVRPDRAHAEVARALGSRAVSSTVLLRLRRLPASAGRVARSLAVLGDGAALPHVAELAGVGEDDAVALTARLVNAEIVRAEPPLAFVHPLVRDAVYSDVPPGERELLHESAARILDAAGRLDEQIAAQLLHAPRRGDRRAAAGRGQGTGAARARARRDVHRRPGRR